MEKACSLCYDLVLHHKPHTALKKISELKGSELYKCCCCYAYLHKYNNDWEIISGGEMRESNPSENVTEVTSTSTSNGLASGHSQHNCQPV